MRTLDATLIGCPYRESTHRAHLTRCTPSPPLPRDTQIQIHVPIKRLSHFYEKYVLTPIYLLVVMAYGSLFIQRGAAPARVSLSITCYLTLTSIVNAVQVGVRRRAWAWRGAREVTVTTQLAYPPTEGRSYRELPSTVVLRHRPRIPHTPGSLLRR